MKVVSCSRCQDRQIHVGPEWHEMKPQPRQDFADVRDVELDLLLLGTNSQEVAK